MVNDARVAALRSAINQQQLTCLILVPGPSLHYFTGLHMEQSERITLCVIPREGAPSFLAPELEAPRIEQITGIPVLPYNDDDGPHAAMAELVRSIPIEGRVGLEYRHTRLLELDALSRRANFERVDAGDLINALRLCKDAEEVANLQQAAQWADQAMDIARSLIAPGLSELEVGARIELAMKEAGVYAPILMAIASGPRSAIPHAGASERIIGARETVWIDLCVAYRGYYADITRTFTTGLLPEPLGRAYAAVLTAQEAARTGAGPHLTGAELDALARDNIAAAGFGAQFIHRTGHGLGLEIHEEPYIVSSNHHTLPTGAVCTIEPGVYLPNIGGIRIEDDIVILKSGSRSLTQSQRDLRTLA